jgi:hypothetical protein
MVEHQPSKCEALSSNPNTAKKSGDYYRVNPDGLQNRREKQKEIQRFTLEKTGPIIADFEDA